MGLQMHWYLIAILSTPDDPLMVTYFYSLDNAWNALLMQLTLMSWRQTPLVHMLAGGGVKLQSWGTRIV